MRRSSMRKAGEEGSKPGGGHPPLPGREGVKVDHRDRAGVVARNKETRKQSRSPFLEV